MQFGEMWETCISNGVLRDGNFGTFTQMYYYEYHAIVYCMGFVTLQDALHGGLGVVTDKPISAQNRLQYEMDDTRILSNHRSYWICNPHDTSPVNGHCTVRLVY